MAKCGGLTPAKPAISEVQEICDLVTELLFTTFYSPLKLCCPCFTTQQLCPVLSTRNNPRKTRVIPGI